MGPADSEAAVPHGHNHVQVRPAQLYSGGVRQSAAVETMKRMSIEKGVEETRATNIANQASLVSG